MIAALIVTPAMTQAQCFICDEVIEIDRAGADCFLQNLADHRANAQSSEDGFAEVDIYVCYNADRSGTRGGVEVMPTLPQGDVDKTVYTLDPGSIDCLANLVAQGGAFDPTEVFDLTEECPN